MSYSTPINPPNPHNGEKPLGLFLTPTVRYNSSFIFYCSANFSCTDVIGYPKAGVANKATVRLACVLQPSNYIGKRCTEKRHLKDWEV